MLVTLLLFLMLGAAFGALFLTYKKTRALSNITLKPFQRISTIFLAAIALLIGLQFATKVDSLGGRLIGGFGIVTALLALYRVIKK